MTSEFISALKQIENDRKIPLDMLVQGLEDALAAAYERTFGPNENIMVEINRQNGQSRLFIRKLVVEEVQDPDLQMSLAEAETLVEGVQPGEELVMAIMPQSGQSRVFRHKLVIEELDDPVLQMSLAEAETLVEGATEKGLDRARALVETTHDAGLPPEASTASNQGSKSMADDKLHATAIHEAPAREIAEEVAHDARSGLSEKAKARRDRLQYTTLKRALKGRKGSYGF